MNTTDGLVACQMAQRRGHRTAVKERKRIEASLIYLENRTPKQNWRSEESLAPSRRSTEGQAGRRSMSVVGGSVQRRGGGSGRSESVVDRWPMSIDGKMEGQLAAGICEDRKRTSWEDLVRQFLESAQPGRSVRTVEAYEQSLDAYRRLMKRKYVDTITTADVDRLRGRVSIHLGRQDEWEARRSR